MEADSHNPIPSITAKGCLVERLNVVSNTMAKEVYKGINWQKLTHGYCQHLKAMEACICNPSVSAGVAGQQQLAFNRRIKTAAPSVPNTPDVGISGSCLRFEDIPEAWQLLWLDCPTCITVTHAFDCDMTVIGTQMPGGGLWGDTYCAYDQVRAHSEEDMDLLFEHAKSADVIFSVIKIIDPDAAHDMCCGDGEIGLELLGTTHCNPFNCLNYLFSVNCKWILQGLP
ncbi:hypothetical protein C8J57DRAFT_1219538 [Mycena rebaudengoi]|nr:hypothetical protein C8J57DRAFT_1219538 [Mycena rebaudengoi]